MSQKQRGVDINEFMQKKRKERQKAELYRDNQKIELRRLVIRQNHAIDLAALVLPKLSEEQKEELSKAALKMFFTIAMLPGGWRTFDEIFESKFRLEENLYNESRLYEALGKEDARTVLAVFEHMLNVLTAAQPTIEKYTKSIMAARDVHDAQDAFREAMRG